VEVPSALTRENTINGIPGRMAVFATGHDMVVVNFAVVNVGRGLHVMVTAFGPPAVAGISN
jgi:hypothetical protein